MMSEAATTAEEALKRAREIAAKLSGQLPAPVYAPASVVAPPVATTATSSSPGGGGGDDDAATAAALSNKRKRWGVMPADASANAATAAAAAIAEVLKKPKTMSPTANAAASTSLAGGGGGPLELSVQKRVWVSLEDDKGPSHYVSYFSRHLDGIVQHVHKQLQKKQPNEDDASASNDNNTSPELVKISLHGRGASKEPPVPGMPEQPLHVLIVGTTESTPLAAVLVEQALLDAQEAPFEGDEDEQVAHATALLMSSAHNNGADADNNNDMALVALKSSSSSALSSSRRGGTGSYRPASVAQLIGVHSSLMAGMLPDTMNSSGEALEEEEIQVPHSVVGLIIGRGGENIAQMQARTGCKVQIQKESELLPGQTHRIITLIASSKQAIEACRAQIERLVEERVGSAASGGGGGGGGGGSSSSHYQNNNAAHRDSSSSSSLSRIQEAIAAGHVHLQVQVPEEDVGLVIGKQGATIRGIQEQTGANVQVPQASHAQASSSSLEGGGGVKFRIVDVTHPTEAGAQAAKQQIEDLLKSKPSFRNNQQQQQQQGPQSVSIQVSIPDKDVGLCIGRQGCVIRHMQNVTRTRIQIPSQPIPGEMYRVATVTGPPDGCHQAKLMIEQIVAEQSSATVMSGGLFTGAIQQQQQQQQHAAQFYGIHPHHQQHQPGQQQQAYSAEWAAYHAAQAAAAQQQQQQQQQQQAAVAAAAPAPVTTAATTAAAPATATTAPVSASGQPSADSYHEQFFRYAYYYGEEAARQFYGAWAPPVGTPNPYGTNPNGIQPAPAATTAATAATTASVAAATTTTTAPAPSAAPSLSQQPQQGRETSRRNVSNLPAWMTRS